MVNSQTRDLHQIVTALKHLKDTPTARLERAFVEHLDTCTYRIDSWLLGFVNYQLRQMRFGGLSTNEEPKKGIYLGAFGWLENIKAENKTFEDASLSPELKQIFDPDDELDLKSRQYQRWLRSRTFGQSRADRGRTQKRLYFECDRGIGGTVQSQHIF